MNSSLRLKFYFVQALTLVRVPLIFLFLGVSVFCRAPVIGSLVPGGLRRDDPVGGHGPV